MKNRELQCVLMAVILIFEFIIAILFLPVWIYCIYQAGKYHDDQSLECI